MATVGVGTKSRDKKGFFVSSKEKGRREKLKNIWKRKCCDVEGDGGVSTKKKCIEAGSCNFRGRRVIELDVLARALDSGCSACGKALLPLYQTAKMRLSLGWVVFCILCAAIRNVER